MQTLLDRERTPNWKYIWLYLYSISYQLIDARGANAVKKVLVLRARICRSFKETRYRFSARRAGTKAYLSYWPARLHRLADSIPRNRFLGSINVYKYGLCVILYVYLFKRLELISFEMATVQANRESSQTSRLFKKLKIKPVQRRNSWTSV
jgi:hypothetical protein